MQLPPIAEADRRAEVFLFGVRCLDCTWNFDLAEGTEGQAALANATQIHRETEGHLRYATYHVHRRIIQLRPTLIRDARPDRHH